METPTQEATARALKTVDVKDGERTITLRKPSVLAQYRLIETLGGDRASNQPYVLMVLPLIYVVAIDTQPVPTITKFSEIEALIQRLDESGIAAVAKGVEENFGKPLSPEEVAATVKK